jgi:PAS domain S-box-containing protein
MKARNQDASQVSAEPTAARPSSTEQDKSSTMQVMLNELALLRAQVEQLRQEKIDLAVQLDVIAEHGDIVGEELFTRTTVALRESVQLLHEKGDVKGLLKKPGETEEVSNRQTPDTPDAPTTSESSAGIASPSKRKKSSVTQVLLGEITTLKSEMEQLRHEKEDLEIMLEMNIEHSDSMEDELYNKAAETLREMQELHQEKVDLEVLLEMTTEHSDAVEEELHNRAQEALRESERRLRLIVEATPVPVVISRITDGQIVYANTMAGPLVALGTETLLEHKITDFYQDPADQEQLLSTLTEHGQVDHYQVPFRTANGVQLWIDVSMRTLEFNDEPSLLSAWHNITHLRQMNQAASRFVPQEYLGFLQKESIIHINLGDYVSDEMTVMFSDLRAFTTISETMTPQENFDFVNAYLGRVSPVVRAYHGFIVKYLGDGIMAIFPRCVDDAVQAGIEKLNQVNVYNDYRHTKGRLPIQVGIGVNTGHMMVGMIGDRERMQGDAFSDDVNLTSRLEGLTKYYHVSFIITAATYTRLADPSRYNIRFLDKVQVKGKQKALDLYEVYDADPPLSRTLKQETQADFEGALRLYYAREFAEAQNKLFGVLQRNPRDKVAWRHLVQATQLAEQGASEGWTGITVMTEK